MVKVIRGQSLCCVGQHFRMRKRVFYLKAKVPKFKSMKLGWIPNDKHCPRSSGSVGIVIQVFEASIFDEKQGKRPFNRNMDLWRNTSVPREGESLLPEEGVLSSTYGVLR